MTSARDYPNAIFSFAGKFAVALKSPPAQVIKPELGALPYRHPAPELISVYTYLLRQPNSAISEMEIHSEILQHLPRKEWELIGPKLEFLRLGLRHVLHELGDVLKSAYFCNSGLISMLSVFPDGKSVEVALVGKEGFIGLPLVAGFHTATTRAIVQIESTVYRVEGEVLNGILRRCPVLERRLQQFSQIMTMQVTQIAACNRLHEVNQRLARWLLMSAERISSNAVPLTQELLAQMLGTRRSSVTVAAGILQKAGLIAYTRGDVKIVDRRGLEETSCDCFAIMQRHLSEWKKEGE